MSKPRRAASEALSQPVSQFGRKAFPSFTARSIAPLALAVSAALAVLHTPTGFAQTDAGQQAAQHIPPGPLTATLNRYAAAHGLVLTFDPALTQGKTTAGLQGRYRPAEGLVRLLAGSGLEAVAQPGGSYTLRALPATAPASPTLLGAVQVTAQAEYSVTSEGTGSYAARGSSIMKGTQSLKDIPQSVTVITRQRMDDQALNTLDEVLANTTGITLRKRPGGGSDIYARGFMTNTIQYDGIPLARGSYWGNTFAGSSVHLDRVEVLRGAQGLLEGAGNPAGAVNVVRKRGLADKGFSVEARAGSWDNYGTRLEAGGALDKEGRVRSRVVLDYENRDYFVDTLGDRNLNVYAALV